MGSFVYYAALLLFGWSYVLRYPLLLGALIAVYLLRGVLPDPYVWARTSRRIRCERGITGGDSTGISERTD